MSSTAVPPGSQQTLLPRPGGQQPVINSIYDFSNRGLGELKAWIETWFVGEQAIFATPATGLAAPMAAAAAIYDPGGSMWAGAHGTMDSGPSAQTRIEHPLGVVPIVVATPTQGTTPGVGIAAVYATETEIVLNWTQANTVVAANAIAMVPS